MRQWNLLRLRDELHRRGITKESFKSKIESVTKLLYKTRYQPIYNAIQSGMIVNAVALIGFRGLLRWQTQTDTTFSREISDRVRVIACLTTLPNIIHSDSPSDTLSTSEWHSIRKSLGAGDDDTIVVVWGDKNDAETGAKEIAIRALEATIGIPSETRQALRDGTNGFERILPGPDRMYPDTDLPPKKVTNGRLEHIRTTLPMPIWERERWYKELGIPEDTIELLVISPYAKLFEILVKEWKLNPTLCAVAFIQWRKYLKRNGNSIDILDPETMRNIFDAYRTQKITRDGILPLMKEIIANGGFNTDLLPLSCLEKEANATIKESSQLLSELTIRHPEKKTEIQMGLVMEKLRGRFSGAKIAEKIGFRKEVRK
jgi:glutamyl-tRNA(Gln) amidotransferase subunit E